MEDVTDMLDITWPPSSPDISGTDVAHVCVQRMKVAVEKYVHNMNTIESQHTSLEERKRRQRALDLVLASETWWESLPRQPENLSASELVARCVHGGLRAWANSTSPIDEC